MAGFVPPVEIADDRDPLRVGGPNREVGAFLPLVDERMRAEFLVEAEMAPLVEQEKIVRSEEGDSVPDPLMGRRRDSPYFFLS